MGKENQISLKLCPFSEENRENKIAEIRSILLPLFVWDNVGVVREIKNELKKVERFILETALSLGTYYPEDIVKTTSIPLKAARRVSHRLTRMGTLEFIPGKNCFSVLRKRAAEALEREVLSELRDETALFLFLPRTDDLLILLDEKRTNTFGNLGRVSPHSGAPVPVNLQKQNKYEFIRKRVCERNVANLPDDIIDVRIPEKPHFIPNMCPAFKCSGRITAENDIVRVDLNIFGSKNKNGKSLQISIDLSGADGFVEKCRNLSSYPEQKKSIKKIWQIIEPHGSRPTSVEQINSSEWVFNINGKSAGNIAEHSNISEPFGVVLSDDGLSLEVGLQLKPEDNNARYFFAVDKTVSLLLQNGKDVTVAKIDKTFKKAAEQFDYEIDESMSCTDLLSERFWQRREFSLVYALREKEDFSYE